MGAAGGGRLAGGHDAARVRTGRGGRAAAREEAASAARVRLHRRRRRGRGHAPREPPGLRRPHLSAPLPAGRHPSRSGDERCRNPAFAAGHAGADRAHPHRIAERRGRRRPRRRSRGNRLRAERDGEHIDRRSGPSGRGAALVPAVPLARPVGCRLTRLARAEGGIPGTGGHRRRAGLEQAGAGLPERLRAASPDPFQNRARGGAPSTLALGPPDGTADHLSERRRRGAAAPAPSCSGNT